MTSTVLDDLAQGHVAALDYLAHRETATVLNLGEGIGYSVLDVVAAFKKACGRTIARRYAPHHQGDAGCSYADVSRAEQLLGWHATRDLDAICADAWRWQRERGPFH
jgi:UDP-glucose 4-epimerase